MTVNQSREADSVRKVDNTGLQVQCREVSDFILIGRGVSGVSLSFDM